MTTAKAIMADDDDADWGPVDDCQPPPQPDRRGRGRRPAPHIFNPAVLKLAFDELAGDPTYRTRDRMKPKRAAIYRALAQRRACGLRHADSIKKALAPYFKADGTPTIDLGDV